MESKIVKCRKLNISNSNVFTLIAGPCQLENEKHALDVATKLKEMTQKLNIGLIYKSLPADGKVKVRVGKNGKPFYIWPNMFSLPSNVMKAISKNNMHFVYPPYAKTTFSYIP